MAAEGGAGMADRMLGLYGVLCDNRNLHLQSAGRWSLPWVVAELSKNDYFGETALLRDVPRRCAVADIEFVSFVDDSGRAMENEHLGCSFAFYAFLPSLILGRVSGGTSGVPYWRGGWHERREHHDCNTHRSFNGTTKRSPHPAESTPRLCRVRP